MELIDKEIADWIKPYATIVGEKIEVDINLKKENPIKYFLRLTLPNNFQDYAIALHSYWINYNVPKSEIKEMQNDDDEFREEDFSRVNWKDFYKLKNVSFELNTAILNSVGWKRFDKQMNNELYPGEGIMDEEHLVSLVKVVDGLYGNQEIELFYTFLSTQDWEKDLMFSGRIHDLPNLIKRENLRLTPSLIYPKEGNWAVNTDYDLAFSTIGGESKFINELTKQNTYEILKVEY
ncbi:hypothetical protein [uncultured Aquimarina sp.]|uniref:hypothetical protein n=1 Tax=uncultured Aquimarina sp. TaxID=575652 RepID=UPI00261CC4F4|nr:hypothetical protein [uncultured Aquimarina sp.]